MQLATIQIGPSITSAAILEGDFYQPLAAADVGQLLATPPGGAAWEPNGEPVQVDGAQLCPVVPSPAKIFCVGLNYQSHILEMNRDLPQYPTLFAKFSNALTGPFNDIQLPQNSSSVDWEAELALVIGRPLRAGSRREARDAIAGYTVANDVSMRDWQWKTTQWLQGKTFDRSTPLGPVLTSPEEVDHAEALTLECRVDATTVQQSNTSDLLFKPDEIAAYISQFATLLPGDVILTGTPGGVGSGHEPPIYLRSGQVLETTIESLGTCSNRITGRQEH